MAGALQLLGGVGIDPAERRHRHRTHATQPGEAGRTECAGARVTLGREYRREQGEIGLVRVAERWPGVRRDGDDPARPAAAPGRDLARIALRQMQSVGANGGGEATVTGDQEREATVAAELCQGSRQRRPIWRVVMAQDDTGAARQRPRRRQGIGQASRIRQQPKCRKYCVPPGFEASGRLC